MCNIFSVMVLEEINQCQGGGDDVELDTTTHSSYTTAGSSDYSLLQFMEKCQDFSV